MEGFSFRKLNVYEKIIRFIRNVYKLTSKFPKYELYGISSQFRRAAVSICLNLAEGSGRFNKNEKSQFYKIARASVFECVAIIDIIREIKYINTNESNELLQKLDEISRMLKGLISKTK